LSVASQNLLWNWADVDSLSMFVRAEFILAIHVTVMSLPTVVVGFTEFETYVNRLIILGTQLWKFDTFASSDFLYVATVPTDKYSIGGTWQRSG
jgi:hypothetical protein